MPRLAVLLALLACCVATPVAAQHEPAGRSAQPATTPSAEQAALAWLRLLDAGRTDSAWTSVAPAMRGMVTFDQWATSLRRLRAALPSLAPHDTVYRTLLRAEASVPLFGGPSTIVTFRVGDTALREIVVMVRSGRRWLIGGYGVLL